MEYKIKGVKKGDNFKYKNEIYEVVAVCNVVDIENGEVVDYKCYARGITTLAKNVFEIPFSTVVRNMETITRPRIVIEGELADVTFTLKEVGDLSQEECLTHDLLEVSLVGVSDEVFAGGACSQCDDEITEDDKKEYNGLCLGCYNEKHGWCRGGCKDRHCADCHGDFSGATDGDR